MPTERPPRLLWTVQGIVEAPVETVAAAMFEAYDRRPIAYGTRTLDRPARTVTEQGGWWYRGVLAVEPHERGSLVSHRVYDVARTGHWMVPLILLQNRLGGGTARAHAAAEARIRELGRGLGAPTRILAPEDG